MTDKFRTTVTLNMNSTQKEVMDLICSFEKRTLTQQVDFVIKRFLKAWVEKNTKEAVNYYGKNTVLKKVAADASILIK